MQGDPLTLGDSFPRQGPAAVFTVQVMGPRNAMVAVAVDHRDEPGAAWSRAGSFSAIAPSESALRVGDLKEELRVTCAVEAGPHEYARVRLLPPVWLPR